MFDGVFIVSPDLYLTFFCFKFLLQIFAFLKNTYFLEHAFMDAFLANFRPIFPLNTPLKHYKTPSFLVFLGV